MELVGSARRVRIYLSEGDKVGHQPASLAVLELLRREDAQGATVIRAVAGFGATGALHVPHLVEVAQDLPVVIEWIDAPQQVERVLPLLQALVPRGLITVDDTQVVMHRPRGVRALPELLTAADVMSRDVTVVPRDAPLREVVELLLGRVYRAVPVVEAGVPIGIITNDDLVTKGGLTVRLELLGTLGEAGVQAVLQGLAAGNRVAGEVMTANPVTVGEQTPLPRIAEVMARRKLKRLPVVDAQGKLTGMVSRVDLLRTAAGIQGQGSLVPRELGLAGDAPLSRVMRRDVASVRPDTPLAEVFQAVVSTRLNRALVVDDDHRVVGLVTDAELIGSLAPALRPGALRSLMRRLPLVHPKGELAAEPRAMARHAADVMVRDVPTASQDTLLGAAIGLMLKERHKVLAVTDAEGRLVGIVDRADLLHGLVAPG
jgi:CBS domain-containing protein